MFIFYTVQFPCLIPKMQQYGIDTILIPFAEDVKIQEQNRMKVQFAEQPLCGTIA